MDLWRYVDVYLFSQKHESILLAQRLKVQNENFLLLVIPWFSTLHSLYSFLRAAGLSLLSFPWADPNCHKRDPLQSQSHFECFHSAEMNKQENHTADFSFTLLTLVIIITAQYYLGQWSRKWKPTPVFLPGKSHGQNRLAGYWPWGHRESEASENSTLHISRKIRVDTNRSFDSKMSMRNSRWISWPLYLHKFE